MIGVDLQTIETSKFESNYFAVTAFCDVTQYDETLFKLLCAVLKKGSKQYPSPLAVQRKLVHHYCTPLQTYYDQIGENIRSYTGWVSFPHSYTTPVDQHEIGNVLLDLFFAPVLHEHEIEEEKQILRYTSDAPTHNLTQYAKNRCMAYMTGFVNQKKEDQLTSLEGVTAQSLYQFQQKLVHATPVLFQRIGQVQSEVLETSRNMRRVKAIALHKPVKKQTTPQVIYEQMPIKQTRLILGLNLTRPLCDQNYPLLFLVTSMLNQRLNRVLRREEGLVYYIFVELDLLHQIVLIKTSVPDEKRQNVTDLILKHVESIQAGEFSEQEWHFAKGKTMHYLAMGYDLPDKWLAIARNHYITGIDSLDTSYEEILLHCNQEDMLEIFKNLNLHTIYHLSGKEGGGS
ncbi:insulinase family protein [Hazenella sp. IB182357]|uniref:Insulinase family protein n=1 Tax=Polycladospora coralii TaxID=2771432 RepID=A0A926RUQ1_9BACL|nr:insulinase family protein [Polycladospora coralii]MBD1372857.1 insulinase family protein [Polycladospora coralii]